MDYCQKEEFLSKQVQRDLGDCYQYQYQVLIRVIKTKTLKFKQITPKRKTNIFASLSLTIKP